MDLNNLDNYLNSLNNLNNPDTFYKEVIDLIGKEFKANSCLIVDENNKIQAESPNTPDRNFTKTKLQEVIKSGIPKLYNKELLYKDPSKSIVDNNIISVILLPMYNHINQFIGALYLDRRGSSNNFRENDMERAIEIIKKFTPFWFSKISDPLGIGFIYVSKEMKKIIEEVKKVAQTDATVLITGESGTGKELIASTLHFFSKRNKMKKKNVNCAAIPDELIESELFGTVKGAATGAIDRKGAFELANQSTLFLDEIGDLSLPAQAKVLRAIQEKVITRLGSSKEIPVNIRFVCATNKNLNTEIEHKKFRDDLYFRINVVEINVPALRERTDDIPVLAEHFFCEFCKEYDRNEPYPVFTKKAIEKLRSYNWPGNIRELRNFINKLVIFNDKNNSIDSDDIDLVNSYKKEFKLMLNEVLYGNDLDEIGEQAKTHLVNCYLNLYAGNIQKISEELSTTRQTIWKFKNIGINKMLK